MKKTDYFLGIDGGGTKTVFRLTDANAQTIRQTAKGASNPNDIGFENAIALLKEGITETVGDIPYASVTMFAGISGGGLTGDYAQKLRHFFDEFGFFAFDNGSDIENIVALSEYAYAVLVIMGTGFIVYALGDDERKRIAGWGQLFDDGGCGYTIGRDAITAVLCASDGSGEPTILTALLTERIGETAEAHLSEFYRGGKQYIASFAELVFKGAEKNDAVSLGILRKNMVFAAEKIKTGIRLLSKEEAIPVLFAGGISNWYELLFPMIEGCLADVKYRLIKIDCEPIEGALKRAQAIYKEKREEK